jgi:lipoprotein-anchoring transpeptidase ErfK/SrfK
MRVAFASLAVVLAVLVCPRAYAEHKIASNPGPVTQGEGVDAPKSAEAPQPVSLAIAVANELSVPPPPPPITLTLKVDLRAQRVTVLEGGKTKYVWPISSGRSGYATQTGTFQPQWTSRMWYSRQYEMAPMPHAVFFNKGTAFHATTAVGSLGSPASHGCIRLAPGHAAQLYNMVHRHGLPSTKVVVHGGSKEPAYAQRKGREYKQAYASSGQWKQQPQRGQRRVSPWGF